MINRAVSETLRDRRLALGISQTELAQMLGISVWCLKRVEHGERRFDECWLPRLPSLIANPIIYLMNYQASQEIERRAAFQTGRYRRFIRLRPPGWSFPP